MTLNRLTSILDRHGIVYEVSGSAVKTYTNAFDDSAEIFEIIGGALYLNGTDKFKLSEWLGY